MHGLDERRRIGILRHLECVEAGTMQKQQLIAQDLTRCTQLAAKLIAFAQEPRLTVGAAVAEGRKHQSNERDPVEIWSELGNLAIVRPNDAGRRLAQDEVARVGEKSRRRHDGGNAFRHRRVVEHAHEAIFDEAAGLNEPHKPAP